MLAYLLLGLDWGPDGGVWPYAGLVLALLLAVPAVTRAAGWAWQAWSDPRPVASAAFYWLSAAAIVAVAIGVLRFLGVVLPVVIPLRGALAFRDILTSIDADLLIFAGCIGLGALVGGRQGDRQRRALGMFCGCAAAYVVTANTYFLGVADYTILMTPDSSGYLYRNACRTPGYLAVLTPMKLADPRWLVAVQLNLVLASQVASAVAVHRLTSSLVAGALVLAIAMLFGHLNFLAFFVLTEPMFTAAVGFATAAAIAYARAPSTWLAAALGLSLAAALSFKAAAPALAIFVPFVLLRAAGDKRMQALAMLAPPILCLVGLSALGRIANGSWSPTNFGGYALAENVAWGIRSDRYSTDPDLSKAMEESLSKFVRDWPSPIDADTYLIHSMDLLDTMFWKTMVPLIARRQGLGDGAPHCPREVNVALTTLGTDTIQRFPLAYAGHAAVQFYGLWGRVLVPQIWGEYARLARWDLARTMEPWNWRAAPPRWRPTEERLASIRAAAANYDMRPLFLDRVKQLVGHLGEMVGAAPTALPRAQPPVSDASTAASSATAGRELPRAYLDYFYLYRYLGVFLAALSLAFAALSPWIARLKPETAAIALLGLLINAYFATNALFMFATARYAACMEVTLAAFIAILTYAAVRTIDAAAGGRLRDALRTMSCRRKLPA